MNTDKGEEEYLYGPDGPEEKEPKWRDSFAPQKDGKRLVKCSHCGHQYTEDSMFYGLKPNVAPHVKVSLWWCPTPTCDGAGVGFDIFPVQQS